MCRNVLGAMNLRLTSPKTKKDGDSKKEICGGFETNLTPYWTSCFFILSLRMKQVLNDFKIY